MTLRAFTQPLAILDLETTGGRPLRDRITEVGLILVDADGVREWSSLVNPGTPIPPFITRLTGIDDHAVANAPRFADLADTLAEQLQGRLLVAHNARFDHAFLHAEFARLDRRLSVRTLCTVRLSRALAPEQPRHGLDAVMAAHGIVIENRHRALDDARAVLAFLRAAEARHGAEAVARAAGVVKKRPSLPAHLDEALATALPASPGIYRFHGEAGLLYVGKAKHIRRRVLSHFSADLTDAKEMRLAQQVRDITWEVTAGELGALLREAREVKQRQPLHNRQLRRQGLLVSLALPPGPDGLLRPTAVSGQTLRGGHRLYGLFNSRAAVTKLLRVIGAEQGLCDHALGLEKPAARPCPSRQLKRCHGLCDGHDTITAHNTRLQVALQTLALKAWPFTGAVAIEEHDPASDRREYHLVDNWCWLGSTDNSGALRELLAAAPDPVLDKDSYRLLVKALLGRNALTVHPVA